MSFADYKRPEYLVHIENKKKDIKVVFSLNFVWLQYDVTMKHRGAA